LLFAKISKTFILTSQFLNDFKVKNYFYFLLAISVISCTNHSASSEQVQELEIYDQAAVVSARKEASDIGTAILKERRKRF